ncbi:PRC-barrel domain-containing protein [Paracoccus sp. J56]|uniref:PRC-barrel domain-containing protein n=1 Tax=Paracoccus sp. J56 TaxID=935850 RepID=UPI000A0E6FEB|nr:PRC-barrel domain-containing protein [Paracoccus sp. J56]SMG06536.1 PRC-barrel domain-containing protein [Paracoccus sp. J56]
MKPLVIAATTLALAGPAFAQTEPATPPVTPAEQAQDAATAAENAADQAMQAAEDAGAAAADAADDAAGAAAEAAAEAGDAAGQAADAAADAAAEAGDAAADAANDAADAATGMGDAAADAATDAAEDAAAAADSAADAAATAADDAAAAGEAAAEAVVAPPDVNPPAISEADPGVLSSWLTSRRIWTTNQPSTTEWVDPAVEERPAEWQDIAKVNDIVLDDSGQVVGYIADIGGFLGIGAKKVLLGKDAIHLVTIGNDTFFATNYTKAELEALPDFDIKTVRK